MTDRDCLSSLELLDLIENVDGSTRAAVAAHLDQCPRCRGLAAHPPSDFAETARSLLAAAASAGPGERAVAQQAAPDPPDDVRTGQLWAVPVSEQWNEIVAVLGPKPDTPELLMVAPVWSETDVAAEGDIIIDESPLGYAHLVCVWNSGLIERNQLGEYCGRLGRDVRESLVAAFKSLTTEGSVAGSGVPPVLSAGDPRLSWRAWFQDRTRTLYRRVDRALDEQPEREAAPAAAAAAAAAPAPAPVASRTVTRTLTFGQYLGEVLDGPDWDVGTLAEKADIGRNEINCFLRDRLDVEFRRDAEAVGRILHLVAASDAEDIAQGPLAITASLCSRGLITAEGLTAPRAASSFASLDEEARIEDLHRDEMSLDDSAEAVEQAAQLYVAEVLTVLASL